MRRPAALPIPLLLMTLILCFSATAQETVLVTGFETDEGLSTTFTEKGRDIALSLNTDPQFISEGAASLSLASRSVPEPRGNTYAGVSVKLSEPIDVTGHALVFDVWTTQAANTRALYARGYDSANKIALSWSNWNAPLRDNEKVTVHLHPEISLHGFSWESTVTESANRDQITRLEFIIGTSAKDAPFNVFIDNVRLVKSQMRSFLEAEEPKPLYLDTPLLKDNQPAAFILHPDGADWAALAAELRDSLRDRLGADFPLKPAATVQREDLEASQVIALGAVSNNPRLLYLYSHGYTYADDYYPGPDGFVTQSIHDPWGTGSNVLLVGASTIAGAREGIAALLEAIPDSGVVPPVFQVKLAGAARERLQSRLTETPGDNYLETQLQRAEKAIEEGAHTGLFGQIASVGQLYAESRKDAYATAFVWLVRRAKSHWDTKPTTYGGPWGMDSDFQIHAVLPMWDQVEESPALTDQDRLDVARILFQWVSDEGAPSANSVVGSTRVRHNHETFPALGLLYAGEYFRKYYSSAEAENWLTVSAAAFEFQAKAFKPYEDCNGYQWLTLYHLMRYALSKPDFTFFENGNARRCADYAVLSMDNLGYSVTYGDTGAFTGWWSEMPFLAGAVWYYRDPRWAWVLDKKTALSGRYALGQFAVSLEGQPPTDLVGTRVWPVDPLYFESWGGPAHLPLESAADKVVFRNGLEPDDQYLLLDGLSNGGHKHLDGNSISRWTENGRIWLADADYILSLPKYHNGVLILRDGQTAPIPDFVRLEHSTELPEFGATTTTYPDYSGVDWHRNIIWLKGGYFLVADRMVARQAGNYSFRVVWNTIGTVEIVDNGLAIEQDGQHARIAMTPDCRLLLHDDPDYGKNWSGYPFIKDPVVRVLRGVRDCTLQEGQQITLFSLLHASGEEPSPARLVRLGDNTVAVTGLVDPAIVHVGGSEDYPLIDGVDLQADIAMLTPSRLFTVGATHVQSGDMTLDRPEGIDAQVNLMTGMSLVIDPSVKTAGIIGQPEARMVGTGMDQPLTAHINSLIARAPSAAAAGASELTAPRELQVAWSHRDRLDAYVITDNTGSFAAVDAGMKLTVSPDPLPANVFSGVQGENRPSNLFDGQLLTTSGGAMWGDDQPVTLDMTFDNVYDISRINLKAWFATSSSKQKLFQIGAVDVFAAATDQEADLQPVLQVQDAEDHGNWGAPGYGPQTYDFPGLTASAKRLRITLTPRPGTAVYLAELEVHGNRPGLEIDYETLRKRAAPVHSFQAVKLADLNGDGTSEVIAGSSDGSVYAFDAAGAKLWSVDTGGQVNDVTTVDFEGPGKPTVIAGSMGGTVTAISPDGVELWRFQAPYYKRVGHIRCVFPADLAGNGQQVAIAGSDNWHFHAIDREGKEIWRYESVHGATAGAAADIDGDGKDEVICATEYYWWHVVRPDGQRLFSYSARSGPHANVAAAARLDTAGGLCSIFGGADGNVHVIGPDGKLRWLFNSGDEVTAIETLDINGDGLDELLVASMSFNVYALDQSGNILWRRDLGSEVDGLALVKAGAKNRLLAATRGGKLVALDPTNGSLLAALPGEMPVLDMAAVPGEPDAFSVLATKTGELVSVPVP